MSDTAYQLPEVEAPVVDLTTLPVSDDVAVEAPEPIADPAARPEPK